MTGPTDEFGGVRLYCGDALAVLPTLDAGSVDLVATDPPYSSGGAFRGDRANGTVTKYVRGDTGTASTYEAFTGDNRDQRAYGYWCTLWLGECLRVTRVGGVCCLFTDWRQIATTIDAIQAGGWVYRGIVPWNKTEAARPAKGRFRNQCEYVVWGSSGSMGSEVAAADDRECLPGFHVESTVGMKKEHIAQKPLSLMRFLMRICPAGGTVLDPFMGSGVTGKAAQMAGLKFVGCEADSGHYATALKRLRAADGHGSLFENTPRQLTTGEGD